MRQVSVKKLVAGHTFKLIEIWLMFFLGFPQQQ